MLEHDPDGYITIQIKEYQKLCDDQWFLECLKSHGVDNWDGYDEACSEYRNGDEES